MPRVLMLTAAVIDQDVTQVITPTILTTPRPDPGNPKRIRLNRAQLPIITFKPSEVEAAHGLLSKLLEVADYPDNKTEDVIVISDPNIMLVEAPPDAENPDKCGEGEAPQGSQSDQRPEA